MPTGPKGEKRPADVIGNAVKVMRIATGEGARRLRSRQRRERPGGDGAWQEEGRSAHREHDPGATDGDREEGCGRKVEKVTVEDCQVDFFSPTNRSGKSTLRFCTHGTRRNQNL